MLYKFCKVISNSSLSMAKIIQENFSIFLLIFLYMHMINTYNFVDCHQWKELCFFSINILMLTIVLCILLCSKVTKLRRLSIIGLVELVLVLWIICYFQDVPMTIETTINTSAIIIIMLIFTINYNYLKHIIISLLGIISFFDIVSIVYYKTPINSTMINFILETNIIEIYEYITQFLGIKLVLLAIIIVGMCVIFYRRIKLNDVYVPLIRWGLIIFIPITIIINFFPFIKFDYTNSFTEIIPPVRLVTSIAAAVERKKGYEDFLNNADQVTELTDNHSKIKNIVIVLGESVNRNHMNAYGYYLDTTPCTNKLHGLGKLDVFSNVISPDMATTSVMKQMFTFSNYEFADDEDYIKQNLIDIMRKAGYKTYWISNQEFSSMFGNIEMHLSMRSDQKLFTRYRGSEQLDLAAYDEELLPLIDKCLLEPDNKKFMVVHLMGSHSGYKNRYPENYKVFNVDDIIAERSDDQKQIIADYDNTILYTDTILQNIFEKLQGEESLIIYLSDHGEPVYDVGDELGRRIGMVNRHTVEVPFFILTTDTFQQNYPDKMKLIRDSVDRPYMTDDFIHTVLDLAEIKTDKFEEKRSIVSPKYDILRKRITCNKDYDSEIK